MSIDRLVKEGYIHPFPATKEEIARVLDIARRDLEEAEKTHDISLDWIYSIAYNAVLQACRAYMFHKGYRPASAGAHRATFEFMKLTVDESLKRTIDYFDRVRKKRHRVIYEVAAVVTEKEVQQLLKKAREFISCIEGVVSGPEVKE